MRGRGPKLYKRAKKLIPGGTQLLSKRPEMFLPEGWPAYYQKAKGCVIWDLDSRRYLDMSYMGIGTNLLGYTDPDVDRAVKRAITYGNSTTLNAPEEVELAELLIKLHPWAHSARFTRSGGEAMAVAVRIARAKSGRDKILFCGYHGWSDWYLAANLADHEALDGHLLPGLKPKGVPRGLRGTALPFGYNDTTAFLALCKKHRGEIGAVVMESIRNFSPKKDFLQAVRREATRLGAVLVVDEITAGWRLNLGGAHLILGLKPDLAVFGKGMSNGYPMGAVIGKRAVMEAAQESFISSTYWTERIGPVAALATIQKLRRRKVWRHLERVGRLVQQGWQESARRHGLSIEVGGIYPLSHFSFDEKEPLVYKTLFTQMMLERGFLATTAFYASYAHQLGQVKKYLQATNEVFGQLAKIKKTGHPRRYLKGPVCQSGFARLA